MPRYVYSFFFPLILTIGISVFSLVIGADGQKKEGGRVPMLSVRESLIPLFGMRHTFVEGEPNVYVRHMFPHGRLNPGIANYLRVCLQEQVGMASPSHTQLSALFCFGFICTPEDITWLDSYITVFLTGFHDRGGDPQYSLMLAEAIGRFAGMAIMRHPDAAEPFVERYSQISSWVPYGASVRTNGGTSWARTACGHFVLNAYAYSKSKELLAVLRKKPGIHEESLGIIGRTVDRIEATESAAYIHFAHPRISFQEQQRIVSICMNRFGAQIDELMQRGNNPDDAPASPNSASIGKSEDRAPVVLAPACGPLVGYAQATIQDALSTYSMIAEAWTRGEMNKIRGFLLDNGVVMKDSEFDDFLKEKGEVENERQILLSIASIGATAFRDFDLKLSTELILSASSMQVETVDESAQALAKEEAILSFTILGSSSILKKHWKAPIGFPDRSQSPGGDLRVYMRRINGRWYWNPFGW